MTKSLSALCKAEHLLGNRNYDRKSQIVFVVSATIRDASLRGLEYPLDSNIWFPKHYEFTLTRSKALDCDSRKAEYESQSTPT